MSRLLQAFPLVVLLTLVLVGGVLVCKAGEKAKPEKEKEGRSGRRLRRRRGVALWLGVFYNLIFSFYSWVYPVMVKAG